MILNLRKFKTGDQALLVQYLNDADVAQYLSTKIPFPYTQEDASWWIETGSQAGAIYAIEKDGLFIGCISAIAGQFEYSKSAEVGYWLAKDYWGQGIVTHALMLLLKEVKVKTDIVRLHAVVFEGNAASSKVLLKSGFVHEALLEKAIFKDGCFFNANLYGKIIKP
ncbi:GNAT family N-acetyltransferase [Pseudoalteromonas sp. KS88]|uniref:GNAT family N-acetyltransferase n=1 Tax=Pseudoalteromonas sp. KS88 TaxID=2109918 RepID=UPI001080E74A|nr:GNAT family N-acetyltransferase [Pseudoalteromonas sp. KS88]TGE76113.1 GNAT family N-acetyltransferase [Pseudoalteromonas sp. KS88]